MAATLSLQHAAAADGAGGSSSLAWPGCPDKCGDTTIPYPFGTKDGCFREGFQLRCYEGQAAYPGTRNKTLKVLGISLSQGEALVQKRISIRCINGSDDPTPDKYDPEFRLSRARSPYLTVSNKNKFTAIGCATIAIIQGKNQHDYTSGCVSFCDKDSINNSTQCTGVGCCQTSIPRNLRSFRSW